ncbi:uncharacterized protein E0L32_012207 [Thyridium curvatum]|uniref:Uncharacterized protein n=1 Tax=Thyridium curvatum TaxID=1093900 RepID=A0A507BKS7_9PEZI|nr:uncharacterized protein E0L32_012207 [Thyridium curvatum]TPX17320.1 hypothetical protein E0L32_012207 [Thyridium curvatum]
MSPHLPTHEDDESTSLLNGNVRRNSVQMARGDGMVSLWAGIGLLWTIMTVQAWIRWIFSDEFAPAPLDTTDEYPLYRNVGLRLVEAASTAITIGFTWFFVISPIRVGKLNAAPRQKRELSLDGKFVIGGLLTWSSDAFLNCRQYIFAFNAHSVNLGVWTPFMPFERPGGPSRYAESLLWAPPMYIYFCAGVAMMSCAWTRILRRRYPDLSDSTVTVLVLIFKFVFDFVVENIIIRWTHAYSFTKTYGPLTLWAGEVHQFPIYESVLVAILGTLFTHQRMKALDDPDHVSPVEKGYERWPEYLQGTVRLLAVIGFCSLSCVVVYHFPLNWLGTAAGTSYAKMPSYLKIGRGDMWDGTLVNSTVF